MGSGISLSGRVEHLTVNDVAKFVSTLYPDKDYNMLILENSVDGSKLKATASAEPGAIRAMLEGYGICDACDQAMLTDVFLKVTAMGENKGCGHMYLEKWDGKYFCMDCKCSVRDTMRISLEQEKERAMETGTIDYSMDHPPSKASQLRGVRISWLKQWTTTNGCWDMPTWKVRRDLIIPDTAPMRCRYTELPIMKQFVGPAVTYVSHAWGGRFGDLVAAVADGANDERYVWIDIFAVRQWPCADPDTDFAGTIRLCESFLLVCSSPAEIERKAISGFPSLSPSTRKQISLFRLWCLAELLAAIEIAHSGGLAVVLKVGSYEQRGEVKFVTKISTLTVLEPYVNICNADVSSHENKKRILSLLRHGDVDICVLNRTIREVIHRTVRCSPNTALFCAACGDADATAFVMRQPIESLFEAAAAGYLQLLVRILRHDINVDVADKEGKVALMLASFEGHDACVKALLRSGAECNVRDAEQRSALMFAAQGGHVDSLESLVNAGAITELRDRSERTALLYAAEGGHTECMQHLIIYGADPTVVDIKGWSGVLIAAVGGYVESINFFLKEGVNVNRAGSDGTTALMLAARGGYIECVAFLLERGASPNLKNAAGLTALAYASGAGCIECIHALCLSGATIRATDADGRTVAMYAAKGGHTLCVKALVRRGVLINAIDKGEWTAWKYAHANGHRDCVRALEEMGAEETHAFKCTVNPRREKK